MSSVNLFTLYKKKEDHFTNGLVSILQLLSKFENEPLVHDCFRRFLDVEQNIDTFKVQEKIPGTIADAELSSNDICCLMETKIVSYAIEEKQIQPYLDFLNQSPKKIKKLILLTPDDPSKQDVREFTQLNSNYIRHLEWKTVYNFFHGYAESHEGLLSEIIRQYSEKIRDEIFKEDYAGVILTIAFNEVTGVNPDTYLDKMRNGEWNEWCTPRKHRELDGKHRKLLLYDPIKKAITVEVEISKVEMTGQNEGFPCSNKFAPGTLKVYEKPIGVDKIRRTGGLEKFGTGQNAISNLTREQYKQLMKLSDTVT